MRMETQARRAAQTSAERGRLTTAQQISAVIDGLVRHWLLFANIALGVWVITPWLAPVFMRLGWESAGRAIYFVYGFFCHQLPERSWFLFGSQLTLPLADIQRIGNLSNDMFELRRFIGNADVGWKVAWSDRMVSFYGGWFLFGLVYALVRPRIMAGRAGRRGLRWKAALLLLLPMTIDGLTHAISDLWGIGQGFRETNAWLAALTGNIFPPNFYSGDAWGSFNSLLRLVTGLLAAFAVIFFIFPLIERAAAAPAVARAGGGQEGENTVPTTP
jgi:uncharacterized membrane protein